MRKNCLPVFVFLSIVIPVLLSGQDVINWRKDILYLKKELPDKHKNLFFHTSRDTFETRLNRIEKNLDLNRNDITVALQIQEIIASLGDAHTGLNYNSLLNKKNSFPFKIYWFTDGPYIIKASGDYMQMLGKKILGINNHPWDEIISLVSGLINPDNESQRKEIIPKLIPVGEILQYYEIGNTDSISVTLEDALGKEEIVKVYSDSRLPFDPEKFQKAEQQKSMLCQMNPSQIFWLNFNETDSILYFQYNTCWSRELEEKYGDKKKAEKLPSFNACTDSIMKLIDEGKVSKLVVDFRINGGGNSPQGSVFAGKIARNAVINQTGKLFIVTGRRTFSSAVLNVMDFRKATKAILIGEPTGGKPNHYGEVRKLILPSSHLVIGYSSNYFYTDEGNPDAVYPDMEANLTFENYKAGFDPVYEMIKIWK